MKQCPNCKNTYTDDSLQFCLADGTPLLPATNGTPTVQMKFGGSETTRINIPSDSVPTVFAPAAISTDQTPKKSFGLIVAGLLGVLLFLAVGSVAAYLFLRSSDSKISANVASSPTAAPAVSPTATLNDETARLREEMANLKKQIEAQKKQNSNLPVETFTPSTKTERTAYANSPSDGFLALRSEPNSESGYRIAKIPHGAALTVTDCPKPSNVGKMAGRWCRVNYDGQSGWAFDGFITFQIRDK